VILGIYWDTHCIFPYIKAIVLALLSISTLFIIQKMYLCCDRTPVHDPSTILRYTIYLYIHDKRISNFIKFLQYLRIMDIKTKVSYLFLF